MKILNSIQNLLIKPLMLKFTLISEITWERYMGNWKEACDIPDGNDLTLYRQLKETVSKYDYDHVFTITESKRKYGEPALKELMSLLANYCAEIEAIRGKRVIGYYADSGQWSMGYTQINSEDLKHMEGVILQQIPRDIDEVDFILSSPGGIIEASFKLSAMIRKRFKQLSFLLPGSVYSCATGMTFCGDEIIMQDNANLAPINPRINDFDTYIAKQIYRTHLRQKVLVPWAAKNLPEAKVAENNVTMKTLLNAERLVYENAKTNLAKYLFKVNDLPLWKMIKMQFKINRIVKFFFRYELHNTHVMPFFSNKVLEVGLPIKQAEQELDKILRKIRNVCEEITTTKWPSGTDYYFVRKIYFANHGCDYLLYGPVTEN